MEINEKEILKNTQRSLDNLKKYWKAQTALHEEKDTILETKLFPDGNIAFVLLKKSGMTMKNQPDTFFWNIHTISGEMQVQGMATKGRPYMMLRTKGKEIELIDFQPHQYQGQGYGSMMLAEVIKIAKEQKIEKIWGDLMPIDAKTQEQRTRRDNFYRKNGFSVEDDERGNGKITYMVTADNQ